MAARLAFYSLLHYAINAAVAFDLVTWQLIAPASSVAAARGVDHEAARRLIFFSRTRPIDRSIGIGTRGLRGVEHTALRRVDATHKAALGGAGVGASRKLRSFILVHLCETQVDTKLAMANKTDIRLP